MRLYKFLFFLLLIPISIIIVGVSWKQIRKTAVIFPDVQIVDTEDGAADQSEISGPYLVDYVYDGDTFVTTIDGTETTIRLIGVDTPESVNPDESKNTPEGKVASNFTKGILPAGTQVYLEYDNERTDKYGRTLAYVYYDAKGSDMLQIKLLEEGMAHCMPIKPNTRYRNQFAEIEQNAKQNGIGFWEYDFWSD